MTKYVAECENVIEQVVQTTNDDMLKVYIVKSYVSIDGGDWEHVGHDGYTIRDDNPTENILLNNVTFSECYEYVKENNLEGIWLSRTLFRNKPQFYIGYSYFDSRHYNHFNTISYKYVYKEWKDVSLNYIMEHFPADKCIQYLKERGISTCPIVDKK